MHIRILLKIPLASRKIIFSCSLSCLAVANLTPSAPVTSRLANAAQVSGRDLYGNKNSELFLAFVLLNVVASLKGRVLTNGCSEAKTRAAEKIMSNNEFN